MARNVKRPHTLELVASHGHRGHRAARRSAVSRRSRRSSAASAASTAGERSSSATRRAPRPTRTSAATSACRTPRATARRSASSSSPSGWQLPVVTFVDTPGAFPGPASEERGVAEAIARSIMVMTGLRTPIVTVITGEGGSGGALALAVGDVVLALENSIYSVISPEGAASILWRSADYSQQAARGNAPDRRRAARPGRHRRGRARARRWRARAAPTRRPAGCGRVSPRISTRSPAATAQCSSTRATRATARWASSPWCSRAASRARSDRASSSASAGCSTAVAQTLVGGVGGAAEQRRTKPLQSRRCERTCADGR